MSEEGWVASVKPGNSRRSSWNRRITDDMDRWTLVANPSTIQLARVYRLFVFDPAVLAQAGEEEGLVHRVEGAIDAVLAQSLEDYCSADAARRAALEEQAMEAAASAPAATPYAAVPLAERRRIWERQASE